MGDTGKDIDVELLNAGYRYALSLCAGNVDAEDLTHDAWLRLTVRYGEVVDKAKFFKAIRNQYIDVYRRRQRWVGIANELQEQYARLAAQAMPTAEQCDDESIAELSLHLKKLRSVEREALYLQAVEGYTASETAALMGKSRGTVLSLVHRARQKLHKSMRSDEALSFPEPRAGNRSD